MTFFSDSLKSSIAAATVCSLDGLPPIKSSKSSIRYFIESSVFAAAITSMTSVTNVSPNRGWSAKSAKALSKSLVVNSSTSTP